MGLLFFSLVDSDDTKSFGHKTIQKEHVYQEVLQFHFQLLFLHMVLEQTCCLILER